MPTLSASSKLTKVCNEVSTIPQILLIEDEPAMLHLLEATMAYGGLKSDAAPSASEALIRLETNEYDAVLLDLGLPDADGARVIESIRNNSDVPILVVSGRGTERDKIAALDLGADDYIAKPFLPGELLARIRAALRRNPAKEEIPTRLPARRLRLSPLEKKLFALLEDRAGEVVTNDEITDALWGTTSASGISHLRVLVAHLRRKLKTHREPIEIANEWGSGYVMVRHEPDEGPPTQG